MQKADDYRQIMPYKVKPSTVSLSPIMLPFPFEGFLEEKALVHINLSLFWSLKMQQDIFRSGFNDFHNKAIS